jgi:ABC-type transport system substrate-binding protein
VTFKGGGDATAAGRAVMETGEFDYAWNLQLAPDVIAKMAEGGKGTPVAGFGPLVERIMLNNTNPDPTLARRRALDARASTASVPDDDPAVYKAMSMAIDRPLLVEIGYGQAGKVTCNWVPAPELLQLRQHLRLRLTRTSRAPTRCWTRPAGRHRWRRRPRKGRRADVASSTRPRPTPCVRTSRR